MKFFNWLGRIFASDTSVSDLTNPQLWLVDYFNGGPTTSGIAVSPTAALALAAYYDAVRVISEDVAKLPLKVYRTLDRGKEIARDHPNYKILHTTPNDRMTSMAFRETMTYHAVSWGNGYAEIEMESNGDTRSLIPIHPSRVQIFFPDQAQLKFVYRVTNSSGQQRDIQPDRMLHVHGLGDDGLSGYSPAYLARESLGLSLAAQTFGSSFFGNGAQLGGILKHPGTMKPEQKKELRKQWTENFEGSNKVGKTAILDGGMDYVRMGIPPEDAQYLQTRQFQIEEIARWFRIPPHKIQHLARSTFSNIEHQSIEYVVDTLQPWLIRWEQEIQRKMFPDEEYFAEHSMTALLRGDQAARGSFYTQMFSLGAMSTNDILELENMNPIGEDGDNRFRPANLTPLEDKGPSPGAAANPFGGPPIPEPPPESPAPPEEPPPEDDGNPPPDDGEAPVGARLVDLEAARAALEPVFLDAASRVIRKETAASGRAAERNRGNVPKFEAWANGFFDAGHQGEVLEAFQAPAVALQAVAGAKGSIVQSASKHVLAARRDAVVAFQKDAMEAYEKSEQDRAEILAGSVLKEILA